ncbi:MAG TPA: AAA family ATPase, partial [Candidatus Cloacimonadota bacterium]|nr:AAA family ATPase [Candidatus Cloacimonadota bacterium]
RAKKYIKQKSYYQANLHSYPYKAEIESMEFQGLINVFMDTLDEYLAKDRGITIDLIKSIKAFKNPYEIYHFTLANLEIPLKDKIKYFEIDDLEEGFNELIGFLAEQIEVMRIQNDLEMKVKRQISKSQKEYFLNEQLRIIHKELGYDDDEKDNLASIKMRLNELDLPKEVRKKADDEFKKLSKLSPSMPEHFVVYNYLTWILDLPWAKPVYKDFDIKEAAAILDRDHYGLEKVKDRILEYLAVLKISDKIKGQIICLVGPPGVGKTSIGRSIAESLDREFIRISLGGVRDESEIRGHRRTYIGAIPGVIMQSMKKAGTTNPLIMLDEIDKMSMDFKGDPASALLEVLDPEQNKSFRDHFLDFGYDLSNVLFITTANSLSSIPRPLYDRMEIISMPGYTEIEKREIAMRHLIKKKLDEFNIEDKIKINISEQIITQIINKYTRESGVRELERKIG